MLTRNSQHTSEAPLDEGKPSNRTFGAKRRALGDITNAVNDDESKQNQVSKKPSIKVTSGNNVAESKDEMEVDDRAYMQRPCDDIDGRDCDNPLLVTHYVNEMYDHFGSLEDEYKVNPSYMSKQEFVNEKMRTILVDWLVEVHLKFKMVPESLYMTVSIIDRYLEVKQVRRSKLQLVGVASLLIAAKYEEIYPPELRDLVYITDRAYNKQEILEMENEIIKTLDYYFTVPTIHTFLCRYLKAAHADRTMVQLACYLTERTLQEYSMLKFLPSTIAATAVYLSRKSLNRHPWSPTLMKYTNLDEADFAPCVATLRTALSDTSNQQQAVCRKYSSSKFGGVAKLTLSY